jgi:hypothetical protein
LFLSTKITSGLLELLVRPVGVEEQVVAFEPLVRSTATVVDFGFVKLVGKPVVGVQRNLLSNSFEWLKLSNSDLCPLAKD